MEQSFLKQSKLNPEQLEAVQTTQGPVLVLAGAGSGKTRVLTHRIAHLIIDNGIDPYNILAITFTNKAAKEMKERVISLCSDAGSAVWVSTFHSMCVRILRRDIENLGYSKEFSIYDDDDSKKVIASVLESLSLDAKDYPPKECAWIIDDAKNKMQSPEEIKRLASSAREENFASVYQEYEKRLKANNALDFNDLILKTIALFKEFPDVLLRYARRFMYIHVDEYQDTNTAQYQLVKQLSSFWKNICVVGDDDQSIYGWRGADIRNILDFEKDFENAKVIKLQQNYRSTNNILQGANAVISNNDDRKEKSLWSQNGDGEKIRVEELLDARSEATFVAREIENGANKGESYADYAVLYRTNSQSRAMEEALMSLGTAYSVYGGQPFYGRKEIKDAIAYLRLTVNPNDEIALRRIINVPRRGIGKVALYELANAAMAQNDSMLGVILDCDAGIISSRTANKVKGFSSLMDELITLSLTEPPVEFVREMMDKTGLMGMYDKATEEDREHIDNLNELMNAAETYFDENPDSTLSEYLANIALVSEPEESNLFASNGSVTLMTVHSAKGLEFKNVFVIGMEEGLFPLSRSLDDKAKLEEERRLCYVAITRAKEHLCLTHVLQRAQYGEIRMNPPSRFLEEIPENLCQTLLPAPNRQNLYSSRAYGYSSSWHDNDGFFADSFPDEKSEIKKTDAAHFGHKLNVSYKKPEADKGASQTVWKPAMAVRHPRFGLGKIIAVKGSGEETLVTVAFDGNGVKNLIAARANLTLAEE